MNRHRRVAVIGYGLARQLGNYPMGDSGARGANTVPIPQPGEPVMDDRMGHMVPNAPTSQTNTASHSDHIVVNFEELPTEAWYNGLFGHANDAGESLAVMQAMEALARADEDTYLADHRDQEGR